MNGQTGYAKTHDGAHLAYVVTGSGPLDLLVTGGFTISIDSWDDEPHVAHVFRRLASFARLILFDARGIGLSDPIDASQPLTVESMADDIGAVLDAVGSTRFSAIGLSGSAALFVLASRDAARLDRLVLINSAARHARAPDYPYGYEREVLESFLAQNMDPDENWSYGDVDDVTLIVPSLADDMRFREWWTRASRRGASPSAARTVVGSTTFADMRPLLPSIAAPTLVVHAARNLFVPVEHGRYLAEHIPGAKYLELDTASSAIWGLDSDLYLDPVEEFLTGKAAGTGERVLATVLFTDIVDSTGRAAALGDRAWGQLLNTHDSIVRAELARFGGREVNTTGDGFVGEFDSPTQAVRAGRAIVEGAAAKGVAIRVGIHTGECERRGNDLAGLAVHIAARVGALAASGEVLVSRTVRDLVVGSQLTFVPRGEHELKGVPDTWQLFALQ